MSDRVLKKFHNEMTEFFNLIQVSKEENWKLPTTTKQTKKKTFRRIFQNFSPAELGAGIFNSESKDP